MNKESYNIFEKYKLVLEATSETTKPTPTTPLGNLIGATSGGEGGNWGGSLPKLVSLLPMGNWYAGSQKRSKRSTKSGSMSDHFVGNKIAYGADFGLSSTFKNDKNAATNFALAVARTTGAKVPSWDPFIGKHFYYFTPDGFRVQVIWLSNVGGNHYDHVHVGVKKGTGSNTLDSAPLDYEANSETEGKEGLAVSDDPTVNQFASGIQQFINSATSDLSVGGLQKALAGTINAALGAAKNPSALMPKTK